MTASEDMRKALVARIRRCKQHQAGSRVLFDLGFLDSIERETLLSALAASQPVLDREKIARILSERFYVADGQSDAAWNDPKMSDWHRNAYFVAADAIIDSIASGGGE